MDRVQKGHLVNELNAALKENTTTLVVVSQSGMTVSESSELRRRMRDAGCSFKVVKNRLARLALEGTDFSDAKDFFTGPTAIAYSQDAVAPAKIAHEYAKENSKLVLVGGAMEGSVLAKEQVEALALLPSLDQLRGQLVGLVQAPATKVAGVLQAPAGQLARLCRAYADKG